MAQLFWIMAIGAAVVWLAVIGIAVYATRGREGRHGAQAARWLILVGGVVTPTVALAAMLFYGLQLMPQLREPANPGSVRVQVSGEQWWWRVHYQPADAGAPSIELANEIRLPVGQRTQFTLSSPDVIHSFWIPALGGKVDMIPGRLTTLVLEPTRTGTFRGICAEFCGASHALMEFEAVVMGPQAFERWLAHQATPAARPVSVDARKGHEAFMSNGCGACHTIRGTPANGPVGPDLTHVGSRLTLAAGTLPNNPAGFRRWIARTHRIKPEAPMPAFHMLAEEELDALAIYMESLQ